MNAPVSVLPVEPKPIAPLWHTVLFLLGFAALAASSVWSHGLERFGPSRVPSYFLAIACQWLMVAVAAWGVRLRGVRISSLIGERWNTISDFVRDVGLSLAFVFVSAVFLTAAAHWLGATPNQDLKNVLPSNWAERGVWILVSLTAGFCEEVTSRGYMQKQFAWLLKNTTAAIYAQGIIFGAAHIYVGWKYTMVLGLLGCMFGWLAHWRRSLLPGMMAHALQDALAGFS